MSFLNSIENKSKEFKKPFLHWELDQPLTAEQINEIVLDFSIPLMDFNVEFKAGNRDPLSYFPFGFYGHYNKEGYELISNYIKSEVTPYLRSKK